ncbi:bifunctional phosphopantothenoylcysteine decarboxylase/phosphopantothenate synthase [Salipiger aestuarii]|uniref:Coenzyme A biosynthesis bifunctional protein CoaBC n=1 Tax=Salipiger aestuarii TaxID=568098 RepID=A0A327Y183_9RHOB|nr:bifunctional phosphopantothenoylcysteine decarboxylase/phosphopantothenate--cysteine ligase CoaBC [Salipiger aestuarii]EIE50245.1 bifunctional phosphopantothenoylcysteine decarboxylase/phosphopantothenate synthase [Citreicella sp. 357]KAA8606911.1 bifunctional phosphopantothenoylcysteine decarboxylase/phosphopantothenate synthase [Salipiger aestuarii]KAB2541589.1 bifunctional phosphopantothenoylcysteine decarboxylase/phosphopantothenate synthase [Salipiger aestuarii]RAK14217.1 phosphopantoth
MLTGKRILLIVGGGIAAYKSLELIRRLRERGAAITPVMTAAAAQFVTPLSVSALAGETVHGDLFDLTAEAEMGHIQLSRVADLVVVCPATADLMAKMAQGLAGDLASTLLLATDTPVMIVPAMNVRMWDHPATQRNLATLRGDGVTVVGPDNGDMACGEYGPGRLAEVPQIIDAVQRALSDGPLTGKRVVVTSGPTHEPIDPVRYIANRSSGAQGTAIAQALRDLGAEVVFVTGPADVTRPTGVEVIEVQSAVQMRAAVMAALPADAGVFAAAVADWRVENAGGSKIKKVAGQMPTFRFAENPDILAEVSKLPEGRPRLVVGFAAETDDVVAHATAKRLRKGCDWIVANDVSPATGIMGGTENAVVLISDSGAEAWPRMGKREVAGQLARRIAAALDESAG